MKSVLLPPVQLCNTAGAFSRAKSLLQACSPLLPACPLLSPPCPQTPATSPPLPCPALLPLSPRLPAVLLLLYSRPQCAAQIVQQQLLLRTIDASAGKAPARKTHAALRTGEDEVAEDVVCIDCHLKPPHVLSIMDGCGAMLKSLYSFKATYSAALTFREGDIFLELDTSKSDR